MSATARLRQTFRKIRRAISPPVTPADVDWVYRLLLGRAPESDDIVDDQSRHGSLEALCRVVVESPEFRGRWAKAGRGLNGPATAVSADDHAVIRSFAAYTGRGTPGFVTDFLGTKTSTRVIHGLPARDGMVEGYPIPGNFHGSADEWAGTLRAVLEADAGEPFVAVELGAGWGPWLTACAAACERRGIRSVKLVGVEAAASHVAFMRQHFLDNGLDPAAHTLLHGASAADDGFADFPDLNDPAVDYGATLYVQDPLLHRVIGPSATRVPTYSLQTLLAPFARADLIHIDIQGSEAEVVIAARDVLKSKARRLVIGTHGRAVEQQLLEALSADGWACETDHPCKYAPYMGGLALAVDGCQVWRNPEV